MFVESSENVSTVVDMSNLNIAENVITSLNLGMRVIMIFRNSLIFIQKKKN